MMSEFKMNAPPGSGVSYEAVRQETLIEQLEKRFIAIESKIKEIDIKLESTRSLMLIDRKKLDDAIWRINQLSNWAHRQEDKPRAGLGECDLEVEND